LSIFWRDANVKGEKRSGRSYIATISAGLTKKRPAKKGAIKKGGAKKRVANKRVLTIDLDRLRLKRGIVNRAEMEFLYQLKAGPSVECPPGKQPVFRCEYLLDGTLICKWVCE
jgi:hypothetical protein